MSYDQEVQGENEMSLESPMAHSPSTCLVLIRPEPQGLFSAQLVGLPDLRATANSREAAVEQLRTMLRVCVESGQLQAVEMPTEPQLMKWFGHAKEDPDFADFLGELRRSRNEVDRQDRDSPDDSGCSVVTSEIPTSNNLSEHDEFRDEQNRRD
jgi:hypothetical protein